MLNILLNPNVSKIEIQYDKYNGIIIFEMEKGMVQKGRLKIFPMHRVARNINIVIKLYPYASPKEILVFRNRHLAI